MGEKEIVTLYPMSQMWAINCVTNMCNYFTKVGNCVTNMGNFVTNVGNCFTNVGKYVTLVGNCEGLCNVISGHPSSFQNPQLLVLLLCQCVTIPKI